MSTTENRVDAETTECHRFAELLHLDAVGVVRGEDGKRRIAWWAVPGSGPLPLDLEDVLEGRAEGWIACPRGEDLVFARLTPDSCVRSVSALRAMLYSLAEESAAPSDPSEDPLVRERARWAYAIHDGLTQVVTAAVLDLEWLARRIEVRPEEAVATLNECASELRKALAEIRSMLASLSPEEPVTAEPFEQLVRGVLERWQLPASWSIEGDLETVPRPVLDAASSVIRESVANAAKHSASPEVAVSVQASSDAMEVHVEDHGRGFRPDEADSNAGHIGLEMMRRLVAEVRGTLDIESAPGRGTRVVARLPVEHQGESP
ncbi:MAG TPA: ATP-binding protein [Actinomycetota bacterium]